MLFHLYHIALNAKDIGNLYFKKCDFFQAALYYEKGQSYLACYQEDLFERLIMWLIMWYGSLRADTGRKYETLHGMEVSYRPLYTLSKFVHDYVHSTDAAGEEPGGDMATEIDDFLAKALGYFLLEVLHKKSVTLYVTLLSNSAANYLKIGKPKAALTCLDNAFAMCDTKSAYMGGEFYVLKSQPYPTLNRRVVLDSSTDPNDQEFLRFSVSECADILSKGEGVANDIVGKLHFRKGASLVILKHYEAALESFENSKLISPKDSAVVDKAISDCKCKHAHDRKVMKRNMKKMFA